MISLRDGVNGRRSQWLVLAGRDGAKLAAALRAATFPFARAKLVLRSQGGCDPAMLFALVLTLPVDRHRRSNHEPARLRRTGHEALQEDRCGERVATDIGGHLVHGLAHADRGRQVHHPLDAVERSVNRARIADVALDEGGSRRNLRGQPVMHLTLEAVEDDDLVPFVE